MLRQKLVLKNYIKFLQVIIYMWWYHFQSIKHLKQLHTKLHSDNTHSIQDKQYQFHIQPNHHVTIHIAPKIKTLTHISMAWNISRLLVYRVIINTTKTKKKTMKQNITHTWRTTPCRNIIWNDHIYITTVCTPMTYSSTLRIHLRYNTPPLDFWWLKYLEF